MEEKYIAGETIKQYRTLTEKLKDVTSQKKSAKDKYEHTKDLFVIDTGLATVFGFILWPPLGIGTGAITGYILYKDVKEKKRTYKELEQKVSELDKKVDTLAREIGLK